jgi:hypothetical protein
MHARFFIFFSPPFHRQKEQRIGKFIYSSTVAPGQPQ